MPDIFTFPELTQEKMQEILTIAAKEAGEISEGYLERNGTIVARELKKMKKTSNWEQRHESSERIPSKCPNCNKHTKYVELPKEEGQKEYLACTLCGSITHR